MNEDEIRKAFEHWYSDGGEWPKAVQRSDSGSYLLAQTSAAWTAFQAGWRAKP